MPKHAVLSAVEWFADDPPPPAAAARLERDRAAHPSVVAVNLLAGELLDGLGAMFWAALIALSVVARLTGG